MGQLAKRRISGRLTVAVLGAALAVAPAGGAAQLAPAGEWRFDEPGGQVVIDSGPHGLHGRLGTTDAADAADPARIAGASGRALRFGGVSYVRLPDRPELDLQQLTTEAVVRASASPGAWRYIVSRGNRGCFAGAYGLYTAAAGGIATYVFDGTRYAVSATAAKADIWDGGWHHVAGTFDGSTLRLFIDGKPVGAPTSFASPIGYAGMSAGTYFGRFVGDCDLAFSGDLDLVRLWPRALSPEEVAQRAAGELGSLPPAPGAALTPAAPGTTIPAHGGGSGPGAGAPAEKGAAGRPGTCRLQLSPRSVVAGRRTVVRVHVSSGGQPVRAARVIAKRGGTGKILASVRMRATGRGRLVLRVRRAGRVRVSSTNASCGPVFIRVTRPG